MAARSIYAEVPGAQVAAIFDDAPARSGVPVLFCGPWGWDEVSSYRTRMLWARHLAERGHPALRFDLPGVGDSSGGPGSADLVEAWIAAAAAMANWLAAETGQAVAGLGIGLGGVLLRAAVERGAPIAELALWAAPSSGKSFYREARAFSRLQTRSAAEAEDDSLPEGWLDVGGFMLSAETIAALKALDPQGSGGVERLLMLDKDGVAADAALAERFAAEGARTTTAPGPGWGTMVSDARLSLVPDETVAALDQWLEAGRSGAGAGGAAASGTSGVAAVAPPLAETLRLPGASERPLRFELPFGDAFGVLTAPDTVREPGLCVVFLNSGNVRHTGPNRLWVEGARRWAAAGANAVRLDLEAIGEADGERPGYLEDVGELYVPEYVDQVEEVLDQLQAHGLGQRFLLLGLCAGAYWSFQAAVRDPRVVEAVLLNAGALTWDDDLVADREARGAGAAFGRVFDRHWWRRLLGGEIELRWLWVHARSLLGRLRRRLGGGTAPAGRGELYESGFDALRERGTKLVMGFSGGEPMHEELLADGVPAKLAAAEWPSIELLELPGDDHTLRSPAAQRTVLELFEREIGGAAQSDAAIGLQR